MVPLGESHTGMVSPIGYTKWSCTDKLTLLQLELLNTGLIRGDGGTLDTDTILLDGLGGINGDLVIGLVTVLNAEIVVLQIDIKVRQNQLQAAN
jgi:hypothetical protein